MDQVESYRNIIQNILMACRSTPYGWEDADEYENQVIFDSTNDHYLLMSVGWKDSERMLATIYQLDIKNGKIWVQQDNSDVGIVDQLLDKGVPKQDIVLAFYAPYRRQYTDFATSNHTC